MIQKKQDAGPTPTTLLLGPKRGVASDPSDRRLAEALIAGESWAAAAAWNRHAPMVLGFLSRTLGPEGEVEDLTQEVFLRVFSKIRLLRDPTAFRSFIFSITIRTLRWELRRRRVRRIFQLTTLGHELEVAVEMLDPEARQALRRVYAILEKVTPRDCMAFAMRNIEGMKIEEVRVALGVSLATARRRVERASQAVMRHIQRDPALKPYAARCGAPGIPALSSSIADGP